MSRKMWCTTFHASRVATACYIGETGQKFGSRRYQHEYDIKTKKKKNGIGDHMRENKHKIDWDSRQFLEIEKDWRRRKKKLCTLTA